MGGVGLERETNTLVRPWTTLDIATQTADKSDEDLTIISRVTEIVQISINSQSNTNNNVVTWTFSISVRFDDRHLSKNLMLLAYI